MKILALECEKVSVWEARPFQLVSLLEMLEHNANFFYFVARGLQNLQTQITRAIGERGSSSLPTRGEVAHARRVLRRIERECENLRFHAVLERLDNFDDGDLMQPLVGHPFTLDLLRRELEEVSKEIAKALGLNKFLMIPTDEARYYNNPALFGSEVAARFPKANKEITEAGNCYATGNNTACIFHLMRAAEHGLRELATKLNVLFPSNPQKEIEFRMWSEIIKEVEKAINAKPNAKNQSEAEELELYNKAAEQIQHFKDAWRDVIMHSRERHPYDEYEALSVITSVKAFMKLVALLVIVRT